MKSEQQKLEEFKEAVKKYTEEHLQTPEKALASLVRAGICLPNGELHPNYRSL